MKLQILSAIMAEVKVLNVIEHDEKYEVWFPHMYRDGEWACDVVFVENAEGPRLQRLFSLLLANDCYWFFMEVNGNIAIHIQWWFNLILGALISAHTTSQIYKLWKKFF